MAVSPALKSVWASGDADVALLDTIELASPAWTVPVRLVRGYEKLTVGALEFLPYAFEFTLPPIEAAAGGHLEVILGNADRAVPDAVDSALDADQPVTLTYRQYIRGAQNLTFAMDLDLHVVDLTESVETSRVLAVFPNLVNERFPRLDYTTYRFPEL